MADILIIEDEAQHRDHLVRFQRTEDHLNILNMKEVDARASAGKVP